MFQSIWILFGDFHNQCFESIKSTVLIFVKFREVYLIQITVASDVKYWQVYIDLLFKSLVIKDMLHYLNQLEARFDTQKGLGEMLYVEELILESTRKA